MPLVPSCNSLYFPDVPRDNVITLTWTPSVTDTVEPNSIVVFKVKSSAPQLFHVIPRYGAVLITDPSGGVPVGYKGDRLRFGLRRFYVPGGNEGNTGGGSSFTHRTAKTATPSAARKFQERFAIEHALVVNEPLAYQQVLSALSSSSKITEVSKNIWTLISSGAIQQAHVSKQPTANLKVYMENVVPTSSGGDDAAAPPDPSRIVPPKEAVIVPLGMHEALNLRSPGTPGSNFDVSDEQRRNSVQTSTSALSPSSQQAARRPQDEMRALKEEIHVLRRDIASGGSSSAASGGASSTPPHSSFANYGGGKLDNRSMDHSSRAGFSPKGDDVVMKMPFSASSSASGSDGGKKKGVKVYVLLIIMFVVYICVLYMRRGGSGRVAGGKAVKDRGPLKLPSTRNTVARSGDL